MLQQSTLDSLTKEFAPHQLAVDPVELITYEVDAGFDRAQPDGVFYPASAADVSRIMRWASAHGVPLVARGAGTGLAGGAVAESGGIILEFARMNHISDVDVVGRSVSAGAGAVNLALDTTVKAHGFYYPPDPSSGRSSTVGGNLGTNAGGPHCFKYGVTTNYVTGLEAVLANGNVVRFGGRALDYPEYDFCALLAGSEGTLAIITEAHLRLIRNPPGVKTMMVSFASEAQAGRAVSAVIAAGFTPATLEMMDQRGMKVIEEFVAANLPVDAGAALIVEVDGHLASVDTQMEEVADVLAENGGSDIRIAQTEDDRARIWYGRKSAAGALSRLAPNYYLTDVTVPRSYLGEVLGEINAICERYDVRTASFFHAGDGNLHPLILCDINNEELMARVHKAGKEIIQTCIAREGSITGEHGVGMEKRAYMPAMYTSTELAVMWDIKEVCDPQHLLNPGKIFPPDLPPADYTPAEMPTGPVFAPTTAQEAAAALRALSAAGKSVHISSSQLSTASADVLLATHGLTGIHKFAPDDLYVTVGAGTTVDELQRFLQTHRMKVSLAAPWADATVGGILSATVNAPLRMRYGPLRDNMLCATVALADGRVIRAGRPVVKNVAGYDLPKVFVGAHGTLGLLVDVTLKLIPQPRAQRTLYAPAPDLATGIAWANQLASQMMVASAVLVAQDVDVAGVPAAPYTLIYTAEGIDEDVAAELKEIQATLRAIGGAATDAIPHVTEDGQTAWRDFWPRVQGNDMVVRVGVPIGALAEFVAAQPAALTGSASCLVDCAAGMVYVRGAATSAATAEGWLLPLRRAARERGGYAVVMTMPTQLGDELDRWGYEAESLTLMRELKARWDPSGILNRGVFVV